MYLRMLKRFPTETDKRTLMEARLEHGLEGDAVGAEAQGPAEARRGLSAVPLRLDHQQLQSALPGLLGRCRREAGDDGAGGVEQAGPRGQGDGQRLLRHRRRRAVHAPAALRDPRSRTPIATSRSSPTASSSPTRRRNGCASSATSRRSSASRDRDRQRPAPRPGRRAQPRRCKGFRTASTTSVFTGRLHQPLPDELRRSAHRAVDRSAHRHGRDVHLVSRLSSDGAGRQPAALPDARAAGSGAAVRGGDAGEEADRHHRCLLSTAKGRLCVPRPRASAITSTPGATSSRARSCSSRRSRSTRPRPMAGICATSFCNRSSCAISGELAQSTTRGCIVLERPDLLKQLVESHGAKDATVRGTAIAELEAMDSPHLAVQPRQ